MHHFHLLFLCVAFLFSPCAVSCSKEEGAMPRKNASAIEVDQNLQSNMVLQQKSTFTVSGSQKSPYQPVKINCSWDAQYTVNVSGDGKWSQAIAVPAASFVKHTITVTTDGNKELVFSNILVGEVWLCSGQSNMWFPLQDALNGASEINGADNFPNIRLLDMRRLQASQPVDTFPARWQACSKQSVANFSAIGYFFGKTLFQELNVPIGLINASWGATTAEVWAERNAVLNNAKIKDVALINDNSPILQYPEVPYKIGAAYNAMIHPLKKIPIAGVIWYQGEGNVNYPDTYPDLLLTLVTSWRQLWKASPAQQPFYIAQICPLQESTGNHALRFAQVTAAKQIQTSGLTCNDDIADLTDIHPKNKKDAGLRLAYLALADKYQRTDFNSKKSPVFKSYTISGNKLTVEFNYADDGLKTRDNAVPTRFEIAGANMSFFPANATIVGNKVELTSPSVSNPSAARLGWHHTNITNLTSNSGLPVCIFKTY